MLGINVRIYGGAIGLLWVEGQWTPPVWWLDLPCY
jgi:hypothetical protein